MSARSYSRDMAKLSVAKMLQTIGWNTINTTPLEILTDILVQYLYQLSRTAKDYANEFGCTEPNVDHIGLAFRDCHVNLTELEEYVTFVDFVQPLAPIPNYPLPKEDNLNFLKPGSKECLTRPVHIHEHLPPISITEAENEGETTTATMAVKTEETQQEGDGVKEADGDNVLFKRPAEVSPSDNFKRVRLLSSSEGGGDAEQGRPTREISSVMMTTSGFISPAREGRLPDSRTPIMQTPISEPPSPEASTDSPPLPTQQSIGVVTTAQAQLAAPVLGEAAAVTDQQHQADVVKQEMPDCSTAQAQAQAIPSDVTAPLTGAPSVAGLAPNTTLINTGTTPIMKKIKAPRKLDHHPKQRKEKLTFDLGQQAVPLPGQLAIPLPLPLPSGSKPKKSSSQSSKDLSKQMRKHQQQLLAAQALMQAQSTELDQPINLSTGGSQQHQMASQMPALDKNASTHHVKVAKAKANRTLAAARRKTEKLNTTITPIPMPLASNKAAAGSSVDKLFNEPDKKKVNILKKISNVRNEGKPAALGKAPQPTDDCQMHPMLPNDVTIELVDMRNNLTSQQGSSLVSPSVLSSPSLPVKEKRKRKERNVAKPRKVPKLMSMSSPSPWEDSELLERPKSPDIVHSPSFPKLPPLGHGLPFPFLPQFSGPGLIPTFPNPLFPNHLLPHPAYAARAAVLSTMLQHHNPYLADPPLNVDDQQPSTSNSNSQAYPSMLHNITVKSGRPRKTPAPAAQSSSKPQQASSSVTAKDVAFHSQLSQALVSSTTMSPQRNTGSTNEISTSHPPQQHQQQQQQQQTISQQVSSTSTSTAASELMSTIAVRCPPSDQSSPNHAVVGSTVMLTPPSPAPVVTAQTEVASTSSVTPPIASGSQQDAQVSGTIVKIEKKNREHKKDKKDKIKKKNKKDKIKKDKLEKKKLREQLKIKLKKEKREKKKEKDILRGNSSHVAIPKLTLKLGSPPPVAGQLDQSDSTKLTVKPIVLRKEESSEPRGDDVDKQRESSPELARISPLVTGLPKPKSVQASLSSKDQQHNHHQHHQHHHHHHQHAHQHYMLGKDSSASAVGSTSAPSAHAATIVKPHHAGPGRPRKHPAPLPPPQQQQQQQQQLEVGKVKVSRQQLMSSKLFNTPHTLPADSQGNEVWICPHCGKQDDGSPMIGCDDCDAWYHWVCVNMQVPPEENEDWYCKNCIKKRMQSSLLPEKKKKRKKKDKKEH